MQNRNRLPTPQTRNPNKNTHVLVYYYNFAWKDYGDASLSSLLNMVKVLAFAVSEGRVAVHCHAGESLKRIERNRFVNYF